MVVDKVSVGKGLFHLPFEGAAFQRAPAAFAQYLVAGQLPVGVGADQYQVGPVAFADEAAAFDAEEAGGGVAHLLYHEFGGEDAFVGQLQHADQRELHHRHARSGPQGASGLFGQQVRGVVGGDEVYLPLHDGPAQGVAVGLAFDGRVALDAGGQHPVVLHLEQQVGHAGFGRYLLRPVQGGVAEQRQFLGRGDVHHVQAGAGFGGQLDGQARRGVAGLHGADVGMFVEGDVGPFNVGGLVFLGVAADDVLVFAVCGDEHVRAAEDASQTVHAVHQHVARAGAHEELDAAHARPVQAGEEGVVVIGGAEVARVVHYALLCQQRLFLLQCFEGHGGRVGVGHVHDGGHSARGCGAALAEDVGLVRQSGVAEVHMVVDDAGQQAAAGGVDGLVARGGEGPAVGQYLGDAPVGDDEGALLALSLVDDGCVVYQGSFHCYINLGINRFTILHPRRVMLLHPRRVMPQHPRRVMPLHPRRVMLLHPRRVITPGIPSGL